MNKNAYFVVGDIHFAIVHHVLVLNVALLAIYDEFQHPINRCKDFSIILCPIHAVQLIEQFPKILFEFPFEIFVAIIILAINSWLTISLLL